jgi:lipoprotein-anchoring transpeptidase ErfK/SrfK
MQWAMQRLGDVRGAGEDSIRQGRPPHPQFGAGLASSGPQPTPGENRMKSRKRSFLFPVFLIVMGCAVFLFAAWSAVTSPALASILNMSAPRGTPSAPLQSFAQVNIPKPTYTPQFMMQPAAITSQETLAATPLPSPAAEEIPAVVAQNDLPTPEYLADPADTPTVAPTESLPAAAETPGVAYAEIIADTPTSEYVAPTAAPYVAPQAAGYDGEHWIDVDLSQQRVYAYAGDTLVNSFIVSTGTWQTPTVTGKYKVWIKLRSTDMSGPGYYLPDVPYVMYFYKGYGLHGTYWHNNFGTPMSHGCVNLTIPDAEWLYNFSRVGTVVNVHY